MADSSTCSGSHFSQGGKNAGLKNSLRRDSRGSVLTLAMAGSVSFVTQINLNSLLPIGKDLCITYSLRLLPDFSYCTE